MQTNSKRTSLLTLNVPEVSRKQALKLLKDRQVCFAMILYDGSGSLFWLTREDPRTAETADRLLVLHERCRGMINGVHDWIWDDILVNKTAPNNTIGYVLDREQELEMAFYDKLGPKARSMYASKMGSAKSAAKAVAARANGVKGGRPNAKTRAAMAEAEAIVSSHGARFNTADELFANLEKDSRK